MAEPMRGWRLRRYEAEIRFAELQRAAVMSLPERWRWRIAETVNRAPRQCWSGLVDWVLSDDPGFPWRPWSPDRPCREGADLPRTGSCYCGKLRATPAAPRQPETIPCFADQPHEPHPFDVGGAEVFACPGIPETEGTTT